MTLQSRHPRVVTSLTAALLLGSATLAGTENSALPEAPSSFLASQSDSRRAEPEELERLLSDATFNSQPATEVMVNGNPVLTDRGFVHIPAADFRANNTEIGGLYDDEFRFADGFIFGGTSNASTYAVAPVYLPEGVTVYRMRLAAIDDNNGVEMKVFLSRYFAFAESLDSMSIIETQSQSPEVLLWTDDTIDHPEIQNGAYSYELFVHNLRPDVKLRSVYIYYHH